MIGMNEHPEEWAHRPEERTVSDLVECLREHAYRVGPNDSNYDPETLDLETAAADRIEDLEAENNRLRALVRELADDLDEKSAQPPREGRADTHASIGS